MPVRPCKPIILVLVVRMILDITLKAKLLLHKPKVVNLPFWEDKKMLPLDARKSCNPWTECIDYACLLVRAPLLTIKCMLYTDWSHHKKKLVFSRWNQHQHIFMSSYSPRINFFAPRSCRVASSIGITAVVALTFKRSGDSRCGDTEWVVIITPHSTSAIAIRIGLVSSCS